MKNNKGFTLIEVLITVAILGIVATSLHHLVVGMLKTVTHVEKRVARMHTNTATAPGADRRTYLPTLNTCTFLGGAGIEGVQWYAKRTADRTVGFYRDSSTCTANYIGTLTAQTNPTYDDDMTNTFWNVSGDGASLRVLVRKLNLPQ